MDLYSSTSTQRPEELSGGATAPPLDTTITEQQVLEQSRAERVVPESQALSASAPGLQTKVSVQTEDSEAPKLPEQPQKVPELAVQHQPAPENPEQPQPTLEQQVPKSTKVGGTTKELTGSARPGEKDESLAPAMEEILGHYEEENKFCGTRSYTVEIPVGDEVEAVEAVGKIFLEEVKVSPSQLYNLLLYNP
jgi:hypothetical protein